MTSKLTREQLHERARDNVKALKMASRQTAFESVREEILADLQLAELALAAMDSKPVFFIEVEGDDWINAGRIEGKNRQDLGLLPDGINYLYAAPQPPTDAEREELQELRRSYLALRGEIEDLQAQPAKDREQVRREHAEWSQATFGNVGPVGPLKHLSKEALEAAAEPGDLSEWADMQFLLWDAQRRAGITDEQITQAMIDKLAVNKQREWPEPKDGEPRLHIKSQPAPVITFYRDGIEAAAKWIDQQREAYYSEHGWSDPDTGAFEFGNDAQRGYSSTLEELAEGIRALHPNAGNSPVITDRWIPVSEKLPERGDYLVSDGRDFDVQLFNGEQFIPGFVWEDKITHWMPLPATPQEVK